MSRFVSRVSDDTDCPRRSFPLVTAILALVAAMNVTSAAAMLLAL